LKDTKKAINHVSHANLQQCLAWSKNVPDGGSDREDHITRSIRLCKEANKSSDDDKVDKIIRNISKEIPLNKQVISDVLVE
jgi:ATP-dependent exoDNAse (exonuclease V) alpha subunit